MDLGVLMIMLFFLFFLECGELIDHEEVVSSNVIDPMIAKNYKD
jgi:hypothetical protein